MKYKFGRWFVNIFSLLIRGMHLVLFNNFKKKKIVFIVPKTGCACQIYTAEFFILFSGLLINIPFQCQNDSKILLFFFFCNKAVYIYHVILIIVLFYFVFDIAL